MLIKRILITFLLVSSFLWAKEGDFTRFYELAKQGDKVAQYNVGVMYELGGYGIKTSTQKAAMWYERSALQGYKDAQFNIAVMYKEGIGVEKDLATAKMWFKKAADQGDSEAAQILEELNKNSNTSASEVEALVVIKPTTLKTLDGAMLCPSHYKTQDCEALIPNSTLTSVSKNKNWYKISGIVTVREGFLPYKKEVWVEESMVKVKK